MKVLMIAILQALVVFVLCLASKNRFYALLIGGAGAVVVAFIGADRYAGLDLLFVAVATLAALWKLTPYADGETRGEVLAFVGKAAGVVIILIVCGVGGLWFYSDKGVQTAPPPFVQQAPPPSPGPVDDWILVGSERGYSVYVNSSTLRSAKNSVIVSVLLDFDLPRYIQGMQYLSVVFEFLTDCSTQNISTADARYYLGRMGGGAIVFSDEVQSASETPRVGSPFLKIAETSCIVLDVHNAKK